MTIISPLLAAKRRSTLSGTFRVTLQSARAEECEKSTGARETERASRMVRSETCDRSTSMPNLFISLTTTWKKNLVWSNRWKHIQPKAYRKSKLELDTELQLDTTSLVRLRKTSNLHAHLPHPPVRAQPVVYMSR
ncbi:unnamed protein product [Danaus chrysippus]|uniref:(African queen) hypothetical protein n=1 Tax=Danaus chrysippus TaxID=151541 RepID=A0A8J2QPX1_9NEOP|nr:unnamed protein product [Danaus chrysippus]